MRIILILSIFFAASAFPQLEKINSKISQLVEALSDKDENIRYNAVNALGKIGPQAKNAVPALIKTLSDRRLKFSAARALRKIGSQAVPALIKTFSDNDENIKFDVVTILGEIGPQAKDAVPTLIKTLSDKRLSFNASKTLRKIGAQAVPALIKTLSDNDEKIRSDVVTILGKIGPQAKDAAPALIKLLSSKHMGFSAANALRRIGPQAVPALIKALSDKKVRDTAWALGKIGPKAKNAVPALIKTLSDKRAFVRYSAAKALNQIDPNWKTKKYPKEFQEIVDKYLKETNKK